MAMLSNLDLIRRVPLFSLLTNEQAQGIADSVVKRRFRRGEIVQPRRISAWTSTSSSQVNMWAGLLGATSGGTPVSIEEPFPFWWTAGAHPGGSGGGQFHPAGLINFRQRRQPRHSGGGERSANDAGEIQPFGCWALRRDRVRT